MPSGDNVRVFAPKLSFPESSLTRLFLDGGSRSASDDYLSRKAEAQEVNFTRNVRTETFRDPQTRVGACRVTG